MFSKFSVQRSFRIEQTFRGYFGFCVVKMEQPKSLLFEREKSVSSPWRPQTAMTPCPWWAPQWKRLTTLCTNSGWWMAAKTATPYCYIIMVI